MNDDTSLHTPKPIYRLGPLNAPGGLSIIQTGFELARPYLPHCLPLYRRLQFGRFFDDTYLFCSMGFADVHGPSHRRNAEGSVDGPWVVAFVDRSCRPETEVWMFGTWEAEPPGDGDWEAWSVVEGLVRGLVEEIGRLSLPVSIHEDCVFGQNLDSNDQDDGQKDSVGFGKSDYGGHASDPNIMLWGAVHERTLPILKRLSLVSEAYKTGAMPNYMFMFDVGSLPPPTGLPEGLVWGEVQPQHFALVRSRTQIPRQDRTLAVLPSLAIYAVGKSNPVAWAFVGLDASLTTLHVEPEWRGRGLAKAITTKLFKEKMDGFWEEDLPRWGYGYVIVGNKASEGMCRSLAGRAEWQCYWLRIDLSKVRDGG